MDLVKTLSEQYLKEDKPSVSIGDTVRVTKYSRLILRLSYPLIRYAEVKFAELNCITCVIALVRQLRSKSSLNNLKLTDTLPFKRKRVSLYMAKFIAIMSIFIV